MKVQHSLLAIMLTCSMLVSCNLNEPTPEELKKKALELATYLSDNYQVGDSVFFETETGETEGFVVLGNEFTPLLISNEPEDFGEDVKFILEGYYISTVFKSENTNFLVDLLLKSNEYPKVICRASINDWMYYEEPVITVTEESICFCQSDIRFTLSKNIGIVQVSGKGHTWTLKQ